MMERTFRSPSPGRSPAPVPRDAPPVPGVPNTDNYKASSRPTSSSRKGGASLQTQNFRTASEKMRDGQKGSWFGAATARDLHTVRRTSSELQLSSVRAPSEPRPGSVSPSINFSYPRARLRSPTGSLRSLQLEDQTLVYDPNSRRMVPKVQLEAQSQAIHEDDYDQVGERPHIKKQPKQPKQPKELKQPRLSRAGSHLSRGTVGRTKAPALEAGEAEPELASNTVPEPDLGQSIRTEIGTVLLTTKSKKKKKEGQLASSRGPDSSAANTNGNFVSAETIVGLPSATPESRSSPPSQVAKAVKSLNNTNGATPSPNTKSKVKVVASREPSESPARSARFAASTDQLVVRHEPPPRSLSPRKSALKHTSPTRAVSPYDDGSDASGLPGSLAPSDDARKKSFRVSWDDRNTVVVSEPVGQHTVEQAASSGPQTKKSWHSIVGKGSKKEAISVEKEETMSPRPVLPNFGSVREKKSKEQEERPLVRPEHVVQVENPAAAGSALTTSPAEPNASKQREPSSAAAPVVQKEEQASSSEDGLMEDTSDEDRDFEPDTAHTSVNGAAAKSSGTSENEVPETSISHASPRQSQTEQHEKTAPVHANDYDSSSGSEELEMIDAHTHGASLQMDDIKEEEEEGDMYSDAYEEITEPDGDGFLSLDAVLESPAGSPKAKSASDKPVVEEKEPEAAETSNESTPPDDWENAKAYWKSLTSAKRRQLEQEAMEEGEDEHEDQPAVTKFDKRKSLEADTQTTTPTKDRSYQIAPGTIQPYDSTPESSPIKANGSGMRKSMRDSQHIEAPKSDSRRLGSSLRKSMRLERPVSAGAEPNSQSFVGISTSSSAPRMKQSLRHNSIDLSSSEVRPSLKANNRPASYHAVADPVASMRHSQSLPANGSPSATSATRGPAMRTSLRRHGSDSSESSFTRTRTGSSGTHEFRKSMRDGMRDPSFTSDSMRPLSPPTMGARRDSVSSLPSGPSFGAGRMRQSLRGESADPPTRRRMPGFGKSTSSKSKKAKNGSRFGDSSDEDERATNINSFKSRFADSSSENDEPQTKSKGKGLPNSLRAKPNARATSGAIDLPFARGGRESPVLENSVLTQPKRIQAVGNSLHRPGAGRGPLVSLPQTDDNDESFRPRHTRRGSFISLLRRKKNPSSKITRELKESGARQDTDLERSPEELDALRNTSLHKRGPSWPLPEPEVTGLGTDQHSPERPSTAGGVIASTSSNKSKFMRRRSASQGMVPADTADMDEDLIADAVPQKKKKFGALRKMFGLQD
ncbi:hypothetical protein LLEC1_03586 [Akanthomyces lecanii]|uniref:Uncharacterized protein n=1 Tax=Cordyceps confragosa TaxID=2714763 RepID=A0A179I8D3_CORDF|nr:hypothetical protein LLEC1_03586 [Akanthomyces lecanii]